MIDSAAGAVVTAQRAGEHDAPAGRRIAVISRRVAPMSAPASATAPGAALAGMMGDGDG
jgi:hypothetical protein